MCLYVLGYESPPPMLELCVHRLTVEAPVTVKPTVEPLYDLLLLAEKFFHADAASLKLNEENNVSRPPWV